MTTNNPYLLQVAASMAKNHESSLFFHSDPVKFDRLLGFRHQVGNAMRNFSLTALYIEACLFALW